VLVRLLGIIPARGGSERIPRKNLAEVGGKSLLARTVEDMQWLKWRLGRNTLTWVVSTDDAEIAREARLLGAPVLMRTSYASGDKRMLTVVRDAIGGFDWVSAVMVVQSTSPLRKREGLVGVAEALLAGANSAVTVYPDDGKRTGSAYGIAWEWDGAEMWDAHTVLIPSEDGPDVNTEEDLEEARSRASA
jgi:N-acylneuraminate cytidylyltransferase